MAHALTLLRAGRGHFRDWRRGRPFWGGLLLVAAGIELLVAPAAQSLVLPIDLIIYAGIAGVSGTLIALLMITLGVLSWLQPAQHVFFGIVGLLLALVSFVTSNFGGFAIGMLLGIVGGSLVFAWAPLVRRRPRRRRRGAHEAPQGRDGGEDEGSTAGDGTDTNAETMTETRVDGVGAGSGPDTAHDRAVVAGPVGAPAPAEAVGAPDGATDAVGGTAPDETVSDPRRGPRPLAALALPLAAALVLASAPALDWPWDWFTPPGDEEEQPADEPSPSPSTEPSPPPSADPSAGPSAGPTEPGGDGSGEGGGDGEEATEDGEPEEPQEEGGEGSPEECELRTDETALTESEEEFLDAVRDCQAAQDEGRLPEVPLEQEYDCFQGAISTSGLTSGRLTMSGARYEGVVECPTMNGPRKYIRLTMSRADFSGAELWFEDAGTRMSLGLPTMVMDGTVEMHITRMRVSILGIPLTFTPDFPPPLLLPYMVVTDVEVDNPMAGTDLMNITDLNGQFAGT
ncbi:hypothetical protein A6A08_05690 [Nocardiopsis sp. TSRI0078]|uniref:DUF6114 domain-containing protein n=1 Tax=unclassified Nocardiopsis TaxID=2649073 RepID=UPI00093BB8B7|nr:DUF6114 domain-containing protein [Nocardiopsis sp. TSRI0078]OKI19080.1 hypothetical protein A6A08_05690 [Nocardiopsis sp. TSRI0078]